MGGPVEGKGAAHYALAQKFYEENNLKGTIDHLRAAFYERDTPRELRKSVHQWLSGIAASANGAKVPTEFHSHRKSEIEVGELYQAGLRIAASPDPTLAVEFFTEIIRRAEDDADCSESYELDFLEERAKGALEQLSLSFLARASVPVEFWLPISPWD